MDPEAPDFRLLFENAPGLFLVLRPEPDFRILAVSDAYLRATMTRRPEILGRPLFAVFPDNPADPSADGSRNLRASLQRVVATRAADAMAVQKYDVRRPDGDGSGFSERYWSPINTPVLGRDGGLTCIIHQVEDVTEFVLLSQQDRLSRERSDDLARSNQAMQAEILRRSADLAAANHELRQANARLAELDQLKTAFFNGISHEFRTPLTLILAPLEEVLGAAATLPAPLRGDLELIRRNALRLLRLVNALLDIARLDAGCVQAAFRATDLAQATCELASMFESAIATADLRLAVDCPPLGEQAWVDREMWEKIVLNLVSNAFKFTHAGEITVRLRLEADHFVLRVSDTGVGIPADELPRIFERFHRVPEARGRSIEGSGIGLSLVAELARLHGGSAAVESVLGSGSVFTVRIPRGRAHLPGEQIGDPAAGPGDAPGRAALVGEPDRQGTPPPPGEAVPATAARIILAEDNPDLRAFVVRILSPHFQVEAVADGEAAAVAAARQVPDLVLSDVMMPRLDGLGLLRRLRADAATRTVPVILISARAGAEAATAGIEASAEDYLCKPFAPIELLARVRTHIGMARMRRAWADELQQANQELEAFSYSVSHDLRAPLRAIDGFGRALLERSGATLDEEDRRHLERIRHATARMSALIDGLLALARIGRTPLRRQTVDLSALARRAAAELAERQPERTVAVDIAAGATASGDPTLLAAAIDNLLANAWKFTARQPCPRVSFACDHRDGETIFRVSDNGAGFDMAYAGQLFAPFQRLHRDADFPGTGIGLATVRRIVQRHGGRIWAEASPGAGATFLFTLGGGHA